MHQVILWGAILLISGVLYWIIVEQNKMMTDWILFSINKLVFDGVHSILQTITLIHNFNFDHGWFEV